MLSCFPDESTFRRIRGQGRRRLRALQIPRSAEDNRRALPDVEGDQADIDRHSVGRGHLA
ncbi:MAG: hypothetical protein H0T77_04290 [Pyrinomonadaceae bacterium]|nr:hypothetical protein [Pyrinomonadaceae bacterium]